MGGMRRGYFKREGLDVQVVLIRGTTQGIQALLPESPIKKSGGNAQIVFQRQIDESRTAPHRLKTFACVS